MIQRVCGFMLPAQPWFSAPRPVQLLGSQQNLRPGQDAQAEQ
jgi:hypothetical protein